MGIRNNRGHSRVTKSRIDRENKKSKRERWRSSESSERNKEGRSKEFKR